MFALTIIPPDETIDDNEWSLCYDENTGESFLVHRWAAGEARLSCEKFKAMVLSELRKAEFRPDVSCSNQHEYGTEGRQIIRSIEKRKNYVSD